MPGSSILAAMSAADVEILRSVEEAYVCRVRDGKLVYQRAYWDPDEALAAAGVSSA